MIRIYQEIEENKNATDFIDDLVEKNIKIGSIIIRATPIMETLTGFHDCSFYCIFWEINFSGSLE